jgi:hypothetical protein
MTEQEKPKKKPRSAAQIAATQRMQEARKKKVAEQKANPPEPKPDPKPGLKKRSPAQQESVKNNEAFQAHIGTGFLPREAVEKADSDEAPVAGRYEAVEHKYRIKTDGVTFMGDVWLTGDIVSVLEGSSLWNLYVGDDKVLDVDSDQIEEIV